MSRPLIVGILLAAGAGTRFGGDKLLATLPDGRPLAIAALDALRPAVDTVVAVVRPGAAALAMQLSAAGACVCLCPDAGKGMGHSLATGVAAAADADGWLIALGDMPQVEARDAIRVADALRAGARIARPHSAEGPGHPVGLSALFRAELLALNGDVGARHILARNRGDIVEIPIEGAGLRLDVDTPADLQRLATTR